MKAFKLTILAFILTTVPSQKIFAQAMTTDELVAAWDIMTTMVVESAKLMPEDCYEFVPVEPLRNFADQLNHTTLSNFGFARIVNAGRPSFPLPDRNNPPQSKEEVIEILKKSFAHFRAGLASLNEEDLDDMMDWGPQSNRRQIPRLRAIMIVMSHLQREHGKTMIYLRLNGIAPAPAGSFAG